MAEPVLLLSSVPIDDAGFASILHDAGAVRLHHGGYEGHLGDHERTIWISRSPESLSELAVVDPQRLHQVQQLLGGPPVTCITLSISREPGSDRLAMQFIAVYAQRGPCVVDDPQGPVYTSAQVQALYEAGGSFDEARQAPVPT